MHKGQSGHQTQSRSVQSPNDKEHGTRIKG